MGYPHNPAPASTIPKECFHRRPEVAPLRLARDGVPGQLWIGSEDISEAPDILNRHGDIDRARGCQPYKGGDVHSRQRLVRWWRFDCEVNAGQS